MTIKLAVNNYSNFTRQKNGKVSAGSQNNLSHEVTRPCFGAGQPGGLTPEEAAALASQKINKKQSVPKITEKDINFSVTCIGNTDIKGNTRNLYDYRCQMQSAYGYDWSTNFNNPHIIRNGNLDERVNGETTALVIPLNPKTSGLRGADNMTMVLSGNVPNDMLNELIVYMGETGILNSTPFYDKKYYVNSLDPKSFMANPKIKTAIADFFRQKELEQTNSVNSIKEVNEVKDRKPGFNIKVSDINVSNIDRKQDKNNKRVVKDYVRDFLKNDKKMKVIYDSYTENNQEKDMTVILIPSTKSEWDCITIIIDKKIPEQDCKNLLNYLVKNNTANVDDKNFRTAIVGFLNNL